MEKKRLFCGCFAESNLFNEIYPKIKKIFSNCLNGKWVEDENLHFTVKFLGDVDIQTIPKLYNSFKDCLEWNDSTLIIGRLNAFPNTKDCRILHIEVLNPDGLLSKLFKRIDSVAAEYGFKPENRKYSPHISLCRVKSLKNDEFIKVISENRNIKIGKMFRFKIDLVESKLTPIGPIYQKISFD